MLAIVYRGIAIPIHWTGNKLVEIQIQKSVLLYSTLYSHFGKDRIVNVFADREFIGEQWFYRRLNWTRHQPSAFDCSKTSLITNHLGKKNHKGRELFRHLKVGPELNVSKTTVFWLVR